MSPKNENNTKSNSTETINDSFLNKVLQPIIGQIADEQQTTYSSQFSDSNIPFSRYFNTRNKRRALLFILLPLFITITSNYILKKIPFGFYGMIIFYGLLPLALVSIIYGIFLLFTKEKPASLQLVQDDNLKKSRQYRNIIILSIAQLISVGLFVLILFSLAGVTGGEFVAIFLYITLVPFLVGASLMNLVFVPMALKKYKPRGKVLFLFIVSLVISVAIFIYGALIVSNVVLGFRKVENMSRQDKKDDEARRLQNIEDNKKPEISKEEAVSLINSCQIKVFNYTNQTKPLANDGFTIPAAESTTSGIVITRYDGSPSNMFIADRHIAEMVPVAREAQLKCGKPQFWHDGNYEQYKDGKWYFKNEVVNDASAGKTNEQVIELMKQCQVDYFFGTNGDLSSYDPNSKSYLEHVAQTTNGLDVLLNSPKTYIFASKAKTTELYETAKQIRQSCYGKRTLYIRIDKLIEVEYPRGSWTKTDARQ